MTKITTKASQEKWTRAGPRLTLEMLRLLGVHGGHGGAALAGLDAQLDAAAEARRLDGRRRRPRLRDDRRALLRRHRRVRGLGAVVPDVRPRAAREGVGRGDGRRRGHGALLALGGHALRRVHGVPFVALQLVLKEVLAVRLQLLGDAARLLLGRALLGSGGGGAIDASLDHFKTTIKVSAVTGL